MKAYLIDPVTQSITEVEYTGDFHSITRFIQAQMFTCITLNPEQDTVYVDDEGLINGNPYGWFSLDGYPNPVRGKGLVLGTNSEGEAVAPVMSPAQITRLVGFPSNAQALRMMGAH